MSIKLTNCLEYEDSKYNFGDVEYFIPIKEIKKMRAFEETTYRFSDQNGTYYCLEMLLGSVDTERACYYFLNKEDRDAVVEQIISHPIFVGSFDK